MILRARRARLSRLRMPGNRCLRCVSSVLARTVDYFNRNARKQSGVLRTCRPRRRSLEGQAEAHPCFNVAAVLAIETWTAVAIVAFEEEAVGSAVATAAM